MSDALSFAEIDGQHVELLPARTVLSLFSLAGDSGTSGTSGTSGVVGGDGGDGGGATATATAGGDGGGGDGGSTVVTDSCSSIAQPTSGGLAGLLPVEGFASQQCTPASVVDSH